MAKIIIENGSPQAKMKSLGYLIVTALIFGAVLTSCDGNADIPRELPECSEFCLYANVEDFHKTTPIIDEYLSALPKSMSDEQQLQALAE